MHGHRHADDAARRHPFDGRAPRGNAAAAKHAGSCQPAAVVTRALSQVEGVMSHHFRQLLPLDEADEKTKEIANRVQETVRSSSWGGCDAS